MDIKELYRVLEKYKTLYPHRGIEVRGELQVIVHPEKEPEVFREWLGGKKDET